MILKHSVQLLTQYFHSYLDQMVKLTDISIEILFEMKLRVSSAKEQNFAHSYAMCKNPVYLNEFTTLYDVFEKKTNHLWHAKMIDTKLIEKYCLDQCLAFNEEVLNNLKNKHHVIHVKEIFTKGDKTFFIQEKYDRRLSDHMLNGKIPPWQAEQIIKDVFQAICQILQEGYVHRNLRPQHIVAIDETWKIQSLVMDTHDFKLNSEFQYVWSPKYASPEQIKGKNLGEAELEAQIVWEMGLIALKMVLGVQFDHTKIRSQREINWKQLKNTCSTEFYEMMEKSFKFAYEDRIKIKDFFKLPLFSDLDHEGVFQLLMTQSKIFQPKNNVFKETMSIRLSGQLNKPAKLDTHFDEQQYIKEIPLTVQIKIEGILEKDFQQIQLLSQVQFFTDLIEKEKPGLVSTEDLALINYLVLSHAFDRAQRVVNCLETKKYSAFNECFIHQEIVEQVFTVFCETQCGKRKLSEYVTLIKTTERGVRTNQYAGKAYRKDCKIMADQEYYKNNIKHFSNLLRVSESKSSITPNLAKLINMGLGCIYFELKASSDAQENLKLERVMSYICFVDFIVNYSSRRNLDQDLKEIKQFKKSRLKGTILSYCKQIQPKKLTQHSQKILKKYFETSEDIS